MVADRTNIRNELRAKILLDEQVPTLDVTTPEVLRNGGGCLAWRQGGKSASVARKYRCGNSDREGQRQIVLRRVDCDGVGCGSAIVLGQVNGEGITQEAEVVGILCDTTTGA